MRNAALALVLAAATAPAQIVLKPSGEDAVTLKVKTVAVKATIRGGVAKVAWTYTFANDERWRGQADFLIAIPKGGVVAGFAYWYQGERVVARIAERERARRIYQAIVARQRDPALVELVGKETFRVRIFPIDPQADLRVEVDTVQALPTTPTGATLSIPLRSLGKLESAKAEVEGDGKIETSWGQPSYSIANSNANDLKVTMPWARTALHTSLVAARSGGTGGFFALRLVPSTKLKGRRWRLDGPVEDVIEVPGAGDSVMLVGRYRKPGPAKVMLVGTDGEGKKFFASADLALNEAVDPNGPATKLWAWNRIQRSRDRKEIVALSTRYGVPSRFTSWIAIPTQERKRMAREIAQSELQNDLNQAVPALVRWGAASPKGRAITQGLQARAKANGLSLNELWSPPLQGYVAGLARRWTALAVRRGEVAASRSKAGRELDALESFGLGDAAGARRNYYNKAATALTREVVEARLTGDVGPALLRKEAELKIAAKRSGTYSWDVRKNGPTADVYYVQAYVQDQIGELARMIVGAERTGRPTAKWISRLRRLGGVARIDADRTLKDERVSYAYVRLADLNQPLEKMLDGAPVDEAALRKNAVARAHEVAILRANEAGRGSASYPFARAAALFAYKASQGSANPADWKAMQEKFDRLGRAAGVPSNVDWDDAWRGPYFQARTELLWADLATRRDMDDVERHRAKLRPIEAVVSDRLRAAYVDEGLAWNPNSKLRDAYVRERHRGQSGDAVLSKLVEADRKSPEQKVREWAEVRADVLRAETELDTLDRQRAEPEILARKTELESRAKELRARLGDPIVRVEAPNAKLVLARLPDGGLLTLHRAANGIWEGRFDVPPGVADGRYEIEIFVDGVRRPSMPITVDTVPPGLSAAWEGNRVEVATDPDVRRVAGFTPDGARIELTPEAPGRFAALAPPGTVFVATDGAHNRSDTSSPAPTNGEEPWSGGVTALARVGGRLWIGTANDGGGFEGERPDPAGHWIKAAVDVAGRLAVRYADGTVTLDGTTQKTARRSTAIAAEGDRLLIGTVGGYFDGGKPVFPLELAGVVVTAILGDGERVWLGTQGRGLAEVDRAKGTVRWHDERRGLHDDWITCLGRDATGRVVAGTFVAGAYVLGDGWTPVQATAGTCVAEIDGDWIATRSGTFWRGRLVDPAEATAISAQRDGVTLGSRHGTHILKCPRT